MKLDLTNLADFSALEERSTVAGQPLELSLGDVLEDPDQPRKEFDEQEMQEITASIRKRGVKTPVSVRPHPTLPGKWILNYGARRYRASVRAGKTTIPAFVDEAHDDYDQVIENLQRADLTPMELALFIKKRLSLGDKKGEIAHQLGKGSQAITEHLAMIDAPACVEEAYASGKCMSPKTLYDLRNLHEKYPAEVDAWCVTDPDITRRTVAELLAKLRHDVKVQEGSTDAANAEGLSGDIKGLVAVVPQLRHDVKIGGGGDDEPAEKLRHRVKKSDLHAPPSAEADMAFETGCTAAPTPELAIYVRHEGRAALVMPSSTVKIVYLGTAEVEVIEVVLSNLELVALKSTA